MPILRSHVCGHLQRFCPRCLATGCDNSNCPSCIGENSVMVCKNCGYTGVISMENHQNNIQSRNREAEYQAQINETRIKNLEKATKTVYVGGYNGNVYNSGGLFNIKNFIILIACYAISKFLHYDDFDGIAALIVGIINIMGGLVDIAIRVAVQIITSINSP